MSGGDKQVISDNYEVAGNRVTRQIGFWFRMKTSVLGNFDTGPGLKNMLVLLVLHKLGRPLFWLRTWLRNRHGLKARVRKLIPGRGG